MTKKVVSEKLGDQTSHFFRRWMHRIHFFLAANHLISLGAKSFVPFYDDEIDHLVCLYLGKKAMNEAHLHLLHRFRYVAKSACLIGAVNDWSRSLSYFGGEK